MADVPVSKGGKELTDEDIKQLHLPSLRWFYKKKALTAAHGSTVDHPLSFDFGEGNGTKIFSWVAKPSKYLDVVHSLDAKDRCVYEIIQSHVAAKMYMDIERVMTFDAKTTPFGEWHAAVKTELKEYLKPLYPLINSLVGIEPQIIVLDSCRLVTVYGVEKAKLSFHVIVTNVMFHNNQAEDNNADRRNLMLAILRKLPPTANIELDENVYHNFQNFRMPLCHKKGQLNGKLKLDLDLSSPEWRAQDEQKLLLGALITHVELDALIIKTEDICKYPALQILVDSTQSFTKSKTKARGAPKGKVKGAAKASKAPTQDQVKDIMAALYLLLQTTLDKSSQPEGIVNLDEEGIGKMRVDCRNQGARICFCNPAEVHVSNNVALYLLPDGDNAYDVRYYCHSCKGPKKHLGIICRTPGNGNGWGIRRPALPPPPSETISLQQEAPLPLVFASAPADNDEDMGNTVESDDEPMGNTDESCTRELLLCQPFAWKSHLTERIFSLYKRADPTDSSGALREWCRRIEPYPGAQEVLDSFSACIASPTKQLPLIELHKIRCENPVFRFWPRPADLPMPPVAETEADEAEEVEAETEDRMQLRLTKPHILIPLIQKQHSSLTCCVRVLKQIYPADEKQVCHLLQALYGLDTELEVQQIRTIWAIEGSLESADLKDFVIRSTCSFGLITTVIPAIYGSQVYPMTSVDRIGRQHDLCGGLSTNLPLVVVASVKRIGRQHDFM